MTPNQYRDEKQLGIDRVHVAFDRRQREFIAVHRQFSPFGNCVPSEESLEELELAEED